MTYEIEFTNQAQKTKAIMFLLHGGFGFTGISLDKIQVDKTAFDALQKQKILFKWSKISK